MVGVGVAEGGGAGGDTAYYGEYYPPEQYFVPPEVCTNPHHPHHPHMCTLHAEYGNAGMPVVTSATMMPQMMPPVLDENQMRHYMVHPQHAGHPGMHHHPQHHPPPPHHHQPPHHYGPANGAGGQYFGPGYPTATHFHPIPPHMQASPPPPPPAYQKDERTQRQYCKLKQKLERNKNTRNNNGIDINSGASTPSLSPRKELNGTRGGSGGGSGSGSGSGSGGASSGVWSEGEGSSAGASVTGDEDDTQAVLDLLSATRKPQVSEMTPTSALVQWNSSLPEGVTLPNVELTYELLLGDRGRYKAIYSGPSRSCRVRDLRPGCEYSVCLQIRAGTLTGAASEAATFRAPPAPPDRAPAPRVTQRTRNSLLLRWGPAHDNGARVTHYLLEADRGDGYRELAQPRTRQHTAAGLAPQTRYRVRLAAVNDCGRGDWSDELVVWTAGAPPPAPRPPALVTAAPDRLALAWERRAAEDFTLQMVEDERHGFLPVYSGPDTEYVRTGLRRATDYGFRLRCETVDGPGPWSTEVRYKTAPERPGAPGRPVLKGRPKPREIRLRWDPPADDGGAPCDYQLELDDGAGFREAYAGTEPEGTCERLRPGTEYAARVRARSEAGAGPWSVTETVSTETVPPSVCTALESAGKPRPTTAGVRWRAPDCTGGAPVEKYRLRVVAAGNERVAYEGPATDCVVRDLVPGTEHTLTVTAHNRVGASPPSTALVLRTPPAPPDAPPMPVAIIEDPTAARVTWEVPRDNGAPIIDFRLEISGADLDDAFSEIFAGLETSFLVRDLSPFSPYFFRVSATNSAGRGPRSPARDLLTPPSAPGAPTDLRHDAAPDSMTLYWTPPSANGAEITDYRVQVGDAEPVAVGPVPEHRLDGLEPDTAYPVRVAAENEFGVGPWSAWAAPATRPPPPTPPALEVAQRAHNFLKLRWGDGVAADGTHYCLESRGPDAREFRPAYRGASRSCKVKKLRENTAYAFRIRATTEAGGRGPWSAPLVESTAAAPPPAPRAPTLEALGPRSWCARWEPVERACGAYRVQCARARDGVWRAAWEGPACEATVEETEAGVEVLVRVCGVRGGQAGAWSAPVRVQLPAAGGGGNAGASAGSGGGAGPRRGGRAPRGWRRLSARHEAMLMVGGFLVVAVLMAVLVQRLVESRG